jgi:hypothetical protein
MLQILCQNNLWDLLSVREHPSKKWDVDINVSPSGRELCSPLYKAGFLAQPSPYTSKIREI